MEITEVRVKLMDDPQDRLQGFCSVTFDSMFVIRDLKIIQGTKGSFVAMPSRKLMDRCPQCNCKNHLRAQYCNHCGLRLDEDRATKDNDGRAKLYADIAHPINTHCREMIQRCVLEAFEEELVRSQQPGYICKYDDYADDGDDDYAANEPTENGRPATPASFQRQRHCVEPAGPSPRAPHHVGLSARETVGNSDVRRNGEALDDFGAGLE